MAELSQEDEKYKVQLEAKKHANFRIDSVDEVVPGCAWNYGI